MLRRLDQPLAAPADPLAADMPLDLEHVRDVIELLAHILADALQAAAAAALSMFGLVADLPARERCRQCHPAGLRFWRRGGLFLERFDLQANGLDIRIDALIQEGALHDIELLAVPTIAPALQGRHLVRQLIDLQLCV